MPGDWDGAVEELARKMMPITRRAPAQVVPLLARGPMTIEADLSQEEAERLQERLSALGVPARILNADDEGDPLPQRVAPKKRTSTALGLPIPAPPAPKKRSSTVAGSPLGLGAPKTSPPAAVAPVDQDDSDEDDGDENGWGRVFDEADHLDIPELFESHSDSASAPKSPQVDPGEVLPGAFGAEPAPPEIMAKDAQIAPPARPADPPLKIPASPGGWDVLREPEPKINVARGFDATQMSDALRGDEAPPYAPDGFDDRVEHIPALAALLSALAPGAGQIYNGEEERVRPICKKAILIKPWVESVGQAREQGEKISGYWAPWPKAGALKRALRHLMVCWVLGALVFGGLGWAGMAVFRVVTEPEVPTIAEVDPAPALQRARDVVSQAGQRAAEAEREREKRFTMSDAERAERLFRQGYSYCTAGRYRTCASAMKRVSELSPQLRRKAFRLQAWAEIRQSSDRDAPMPDVGPVESLSEYEMMMLSSEPE